MDHETAVEDKLKEGELERDVEIKSAKEQTDKIWKKKFSERETVLEERLKDLDVEMTQIRDKHSEDLKRERERVEVRIRETLRAEVRNEIADQLSIEFSGEMQKANETHQ